MKSIIEAAQDLLNYGDWDFTQPNWCGSDLLELSDAQKEQYANHMKLELQAMIDEGGNRYELPIGVDPDEFVQEKAQSIAESFVVNDDRSH